MVNSTSALDYRLDDVSFQSELYYFAIMGIRTQCIGFQSYLLAASI